MSESWGLLFTLIFFVGIFDLREWLEWKSVEDRVKRRIGRLLRATFATLSIFCRVERVHYEPNEKEKKIELVERQLNTLISEEIKFTKETEKNLLDETNKQSLKAILDSRINRLGGIEERYSRLLGSEVRGSLMDIQEYMDELCLEFSIPHMRKEDFFKRVKELVSKIMKETQKMKSKGFWVDW